MRKHYSLFTILFTFLVVFATCSQESKSMKLYEVYKDDPHPQSSSSSHRSTPMMGVSPWHQDQKRQRTDKTSQVIPTRPEEKLLYSTVRIQRGVSVGTGYLLKKNDTIFLVTNKHVVKPDPEKVSSASEKSIRSAIRGASFSLYFHYIESSHSNDLKRMRIVFPATFEECFQSRYGSVLDMCYLNLTPLFSRFETEKGHGKIYICPLDLSSYNPNASFRSVYGDSSKDIAGSSFNSIGFNLSSPVTMVGYPTGLWDDVNNYPLLRKGSVATHPHIDFQGKKEFLIDIPLYPGSSGSPVLYSREREGKTHMYFVGMVWGGPTHPILKMSYPTDKTDTKGILDTQSTLIAGLQEEHRDQNERIARIENHLGISEQGVESSDEASSASSRPFINIAHVIKAEEVLREISSGGAKSNWSKYTIKYATSDKLSDLIAKREDDRRGWDPL